MTEQPLSFGDLNLVIFEAGDYKGRFGLQNPFTGYLLIESDGIPRNYATEDEAVAAAHLLQQKLQDLFTKPNLIRKEAAS